MSDASAPSASFDDLLGLRVTSATADRAEGTLEVTPKLFQPYGIVHGGVYCSAIESLASYGAAVWFGDRGQVVGVSNHTNFLRATRTGPLHLVATPVHRGRTQQLWSVEVTGPDSRPVATGQVRLANISDPAALGRPVSQA